MPEGSSDDDSDQDGGMPEEQDDDDPKPVAVDDIWRKRNESLE